MKQLALIKIDEQYGYIDSSGEIIIKPRYSMASSFKDGLAYVETETEVGFINSRGETVFSYDSLYHQIGTFFNEKRVRFYRSPRRKNGPEERRGDIILPVHININEGAGFLDTEGEMVFEPQYDWVENFSEGLAAVAAGVKAHGHILIEPQGRWGYIDTAGKPVIEMKYEQAQSFHDGLAAVKQDGLWGYIDREGVMIIQPQFKKAFGFYNGLAPVYNGSKYGFINELGELIIDYTYDSVNNLQEGFIAVNIGAEDESFIGSEKYVLGGYWFFIDSKGKPAGDEKYIDIRDYSEGLGFIYSSGKWVMVDKNAGCVMSLQYNDVKNFKNGLAPVQEGDKWGFMNTKGEPVIAPQFDDAFQFEKIEE